MKITGVKIRRLFLDEENPVKAVVSVTLDDAFAIHDLKIIQGVERLFVAMPNRRSEDGRFQDVAHPITQMARRALEEAVFEAYDNALFTANIEADTGGDTRKAG